MNATDKSFHAIIQKLHIYGLFNLYSSMAFSIFGTITNLIAIFIFTRKPFLKQTLSLYLIFVCIFDTMSLLSIWIKYKLHLQHPSSNPQHNLTICRIMFFIRYSTMQISSWLLVLASLDRMISVIWLSFTLRKKKWFQLLLIGLVICFFGAFNIRFLLTNKHKLIDGRMGCSMMKKYLLVHAIVTSFVFAIIPFVLMIVSSIVILHKVFKSKKASNAVTNNNSVIQRVKIIIGANIFFLLTNAPLCVIIIASNVYYSRYKSRKDPFEPYYAVAYTLSLIHKSCSIFVYTAANNLFKSEIVKFFKCTTSLRRR